MLQHAEKPLFNHVGTLAVCLFHRIFFIFVLKFVPYFFTLKLARVKTPLSFIEAHLQNNCNDVKRISPSKLDGLNTDN